MSQQGRLAAARGPVERQALARRHLQAEPVEHRQAHAALHVQHEGLRKILHADRRAFHHLAHVTSYLPNQTWRTEERSEEHTSELQSLMRISYHVVCLKKKN